jgi:hypothetical protein
LGHGEGARVIKPKLLSKERLEEIAEFHAKLEGNVHTRQQYIVTVQRELLAHVAAQDAKLATVKVECEHNAVEGCTEYSDGKQEVAEDILKILETDNA